MSKFLIRWFITSCAVAIAAQVVPGIHYDGYMNLIVAALVLGILNAVARPVMIILSLPAVVLSFGLFILFINAVLLYFTGYLMKGFHVETFWAAFWGALIISIVSFILNAFAKTSNSRVHFHKKPLPPLPPKDDGKGPVIDV